MPCSSSSSDNYSEEEYESFSSEQEASDDAVQGQVRPTGQEGPLDNGPRFNLKLYHVDLEILNWYLKL